MVGAFWLSAAVGTVLGFLSGLGVGGGSLLLLWLTLVLDTDPATARQINLLFYLPGAAISCALRKKQGGPQGKKLLPAIAAGCLGAAGGTLAGKYLDTRLLKKAFGLLLLFTGTREILWKPKEKHP